MIESALTRPRNLYADNERATIPELAAAYCYGLAKNHGFADGNKRVSAVVCELFLELNGFRFTAEDAEWLQIMLTVADGSLGEPVLAQWLTQHASAIEAGHA